MFVHWNIWRNIDRNRSLTINFKCVFHTFNIFLRCQFTTLSERFKAHLESVWVGEGEGLVRHFKKWVNPI